MKQSYQFALTKLIYTVVSLSYTRGVVWQPLACSGSLWVCVMVRVDCGWLWLGMVELSWPLGGLVGFEVSNHGHYVDNPDQCYRWERVWEVSSDSSWQWDDRFAYLIFTGWYRSWLANPLVSGWSILVGGVKSWYLFLVLELVSTRDDIPKKLFCKIVVKLILLFWINCKLHP